MIMVLVPSGCRLRFGGLGDLINQPVFHGDQRPEFPAATLEMRTPRDRKGSVRPIFLAKDKRFGVLQRLTDGGLKVFLGLIVYDHCHGSVSLCFRVRFDELNMYHAIPKVYKKSEGEFIFIYRGWVVCLAYIYNEKAKVVWGMHHRK
jgi:hypothetical protein